MTAQVGFWLFMGLATLAGGAWTLVMLTARQFEKRLDERFLAQERAREEGRKHYDERFGKIENDVKEVEKGYLSLRAELPEKYVRREDHIRSETVINAKIDAVYTKLELIAERQLQQKG